MIHEKLSFFWGDISIYPGNSGGPVFSKDKLIGIVSSQASIPIENEIEGIALDEFHTRIPFAKLIKARNLIHLLEEQIEKDNRQASLSDGSYFKKFRESQKNESSRRKLC